MPFFTVKVLRTQKFVYLIEAATKADAEGMALDATKKGEKPPYDSKMAVRSIAVDPDTI